MSPLVPSLLSLLGLLSLPPIAWAGLPAPLADCEAPEATVPGPEGPEAPTPEDLLRYQQLARADRLYRCGETFLAEKLYRQAKPPFPAEGQWERELVPQPLYDPESLLPGGGVYWRLYQESLAEEALASKRFAALKLLVERHPEFIPGHLHYAEALHGAGQPGEARQVLQEAVALYPNEVPLVEAKIEADRAAGDWLEASLTARQFALFNPDRFRAPEFARWAEEDLRRYQAELQSQLTWNAVGNAIVGGLGYALTGNLWGPLSALEMTVLLLQGESAIGERLAEGLKGRLPLLEDPEVLGYVEEIGQQLAAVAGRDELDYDFTVVADEELNAFALPGGKVFVNAGAIVKTHSEAELAGLLAHELAHAVLSHGFQQMAKGGLTVNVTQYIPYVGRLAGNLLVFNYSREMERQADWFGTRLLAASGYAADGVRNLMVTLEREGEGDPKVPAWLSTHPDTGDRTRYLERAIVTEQLNRYAYEGVSRHRTIQQKTAQLLEELEQNRRAADD